LRAELGLEYDQLERGILHFYTDADELTHAIPQAALMRELGCDRVLKTATECLMIEPALRHAQVPILGGTFTAADESGDARQFVLALVERCRERGVHFRYDSSIDGLNAAGGRITGVRLAGGDVLEADAYVLALGSYSPLLLRPLGMSLPVYPAKGYSLTIPIPPGCEAPTVSLTDDGCKLVYSRLGQRLRVAGTAEFCGYDTSVPVARCAPLQRRTRQLFPQLPQGEAVERWCGLRPATPSNVPLVCRSALSNLYLNTGHGTLGWTLACGSGRLLADLIDARPAEVDSRPYRLD
jgi:D-amino-acid dehydrogenase